MRAPNWKRIGFLAWLFFGTLALASDPAAGGKSSSGSSFKIRQYATSALPTCSSSSNVGLIVWDTTVSRPKVCAGTAGWVPYGLAGSYATGSLPTCDASHNLGMVAWDTTAGASKVCQGGSGWTTFFTAASVPEANPYTVWNAESTTTPSVGSFTQFAETGVSTPSYTVDTTYGNLLRVTQANGAGSWGKLVGYLGNATGVNSFRTRASIRLYPGTTLQSTANRFGIAVNASVTGSVFTGYIFWLLGDGASARSLYFTKDNAGTQTNFKGPVNIDTVFPAIGASNQLNTADNLLLEVENNGGWLTARINGIALWKVYDTALTGGGGAVFAEPAATGQVQSDLHVGYFDVVPVIGGR